MRFALALPHFAQNIRSTHKEEQTMAQNVYVSSHPLLEHKLSILRDERTGTREFREVLKEVTMLLGYEATRDLPTEDIEVTTPVAKCTCKKLSGRKLVLVPILRAGIGMVDGFLQLLPSAKVGHIGLSRNEETLEPIEYYAKVPNELDQRNVIVVDPMLATGGSAVAALTKLKERGAKNLRLVCLVAAPDGVAAVQKAHPEVPIYLAALDEKLNEKGYIVPGLGDAGDRIFGTL